MVQMPATPIESSQLLVSIVIVSYNGRSYIAACLDSVLDQDLKREQYEVIVADNASQDGTADFVEQNYPQVRVLRLERNYGPGEALQRAREQVRGKLIAYLNQDAVAHRRWLSELYDAITSHPQAGIVESNMILSKWPEYYETRSRDSVVERAFICDLTRYGIQDFRIVPVTPSSPPIPLLSAYGAGCILRPEVLDRLGYWFDPGFFAYFDDIDLGLRLNAAGYQVLLAPRSLVYHDTIWLFEWNWRSIRRAFLSTRNMVLVFYKLAYTSEFIRLLPILLLGKLVRAGQHTDSRVGKLVYALAGLPLLTIGLVAAIWRMPAYRQIRRETLSHRKTPPGWLVESLDKIDWKADQEIWDKPVTSAARKQSVTAGE